MAKALGVDRQALLLSGLDGDVPSDFEELVQRRATGEPMAYIIGRRAFWTIGLEVAPGVLIPRPDSETLIEAAVAHFAERAPLTILDLGTGSGALLLAALDQWQSARGIGIDVSEKALAIASANAQRLGMGERAVFRRGDWAEDLDQRFDLVLCNPPYVEAGAPLPRDVAEWEPESALFAGEDGLDAYRRLAPQIGPLLEPGGVACVEIGAGQADEAGALFAGHGLSITSRRDLGGHIRCLILTT
jgi:release factor glutamine methyltransferase